MPSGGRAVEAEDPPPISPNPTPSTQDLLLSAVSGPDRGRLLRFAPGASYVIGRMGDADLDLRHLTDPSVSRHHLRIEVGAAPPAKAVVLETTNPVTLDGRLVLEAALPAGSRLQLGDTSLQVAYGPATDAEESRRIPRRRLADYEVVEELGRGALGCVYRARDKRDGGHVALKCLTPRVDGTETPRAEQAVAYFRREVDLTATLTHPSIVRALALGRDDEELFLALEYIDGGSLTDWVGAHGRLVPGRARALGAALLGALGHAHAQGVVHRDVSPQNVLIGSGPRAGHDVWLTDFGIGKIDSGNAVATLTETGEARGKLEYMAPECFRDARHASPAADLFGVAATLCFALTGEPWLAVAEDRPRSGDRWTRLAAGDVSRVGLRRRREIPPGLAEILVRGLAHEPAQRYPDAATMARALSSEE